MRSILLLMCVLVALTGLSGCNAPEPPTITPERVELISKGLSGATFRVHGTAYNPNSVALPIRSLEAKLTLGGASVGNVTATGLTTLVAHAKTPVAFDVMVPLTSLGAAIPIATTRGDDIPYTIDGTAYFEVAGSKLHVSFNFDGKVKKSELVSSTLPSLLPGLPGFPK